MLILIYTPGTDEDSIIETFKNQCDLNDKVKKLKLHYSDYAIFVGEVVKSFDQKSYPLIARCLEEGN